jgi:hypothetical protein
MFVTATLRVNPRMALVVPRAAVVRLAGQNIAFVEKGDAPVPGKVRFEHVPVDVDERSPDGVVPVRRGLSRGDRVAVSNVQILSSLARTSP